jgi:hypothetical protein
MLITIALPCKPVLNWPVFLLADEIQAELPCWNRLLA